MFNQLQADIKTHIRSKQMWSEILSISEKLMNASLPHILWQDLKSAALLRAAGLLAMETMHNYNVDFLFLLTSWQWRTELASSHPCS